MTKAKTYLIALIFFCLAALLIFSQYLFDSGKAKAGFADPVIPRAEIVRYIDLGLHNAAADLAWLGTIQYYGGRVTPRYDSLDDYFILSTKLDPHFVHPYTFGTLILPTIGQLDYGLALAKEGIKNNPDDWKIPYYLASASHIYLNDRVSAAQYFDIAAGKKDSPEGIKKLAASYGANGSVRSKTIAIWEQIYNETNDEIAKERARNNIIHMEIMTLLDAAAAKYKDSQGSYPKVPDELVAAKILKMIPADPLGFTYQFDSGGKAVIK